MTPELKEKMLSSLKGFDVEGGTPALIAEVEAAQCVEFLEWAVWKKNEKCIISRCYSSKEEAEGLIKQFNHPENYKAIPLFTIEKE